MGEKLRSVCQSVFKSGTRRLQNTFSSTEKKGDLREASSPPPNDPPPAYTAAAPPAAASSASASSSTPFHMDHNINFDRLKEFDMVFLIDDSKSMLQTSWKDKKVISRWNEVRALLLKIAPICTDHDPDGIDVYFLNHKSGMKEDGKGKNGYYDVKNDEHVTEIFRRTHPHGWTPTGERVKNILEPYMRRLERAKNLREVRPMIIVVMTDGGPTDEKVYNQLEVVLKNVTSRLTKMGVGKGQLGLQFFQVGDDKEATDALANLDGDKTEGLDIVDTTTWQNLGDKTGGLGLTVEGIFKVLLGSVDKDADKMKV